jgi:histidine triad (HIT) family protein
MDCIFCKIVKKEIQSEIVYEDDNFIAFVDIHPRSKGMTLIIPKKHVKDLEEDENLSKQLFWLAIKISNAIKKALSPLAIGIAYMPSQIEHLHIRVYPYFENEIPLLENKPLEISPGELKSIAEKIRKNLLIEVPKKEEVKEEKVEKKEEAQEKKEKTKSEEEIFWSKRDWLIA